MASTLSDLDLELEELEEDEDEEEEEETGEPCGLLCGCGDEEFIKLHEDVAIVHLSKIHCDNQGELYYEILCDPDTGEPIVGPLIYRYECWENVGQELAEAVEDSPPQEEPGAAIYCDYCGSSIRVGKNGDGGEKCATVHLGEIALSERVSGTTTFIPAVKDDNDQVEADPYVICLPCVRLMVSAKIERFEAFQLWDDFVSQNDECIHCTNARCWRMGRCFCKCHVVPR